MALLWGDRPVCLGALGAWLMRLARTGSAHAGLIEWLVQRISAIYVGVFVLGMGLSLYLYPPTDVVAWRAFFEPRWLRVLWLLFYFSLMAHAFVGMRSVFLDYVRPSGLRFILTLLTGSGLAICGLWLVDVLYHGVNA